MIHLDVDAPAVIPMTVSEAFVDYDVPEYTGAYSVTPSSSAQTLPTNGKLMTDDVTVDAVSIDLQSKTVNPSTTATTVAPDDGKDGLSSVTVNAMPSGTLDIPDIEYADRLGVAYVDITVGVDDDGYVDSSDGFTYPVKVNDIPNLPKQTATTITPTTSEQTAVAAKKWTTGAVKVGAIPSQYIVPSGTVAITANTSSANVKTYEFASVSVPNTYTASDEGKVVSSGTLVSQTSDTCTSNGVVDTTLINSLDVNVSGGGGGVTKIAYGTLTGDGGSTLTCPVGKKMAQSDFLLNLWVQSGTEYTNNADYQVICLSFLVQKKYAHYDLSTDGTKGGTYDYYIVDNNAGTKKNVQINGFQSDFHVIRNGNRSGAITANLYGSNNFKIIRDSSGFSFSIPFYGSGYKLVSGMTYNWELLYIGSDPTNDIVEVV